MQKKLNVLLMDTILARCTPSSGEHKPNLNTLGELFFSYTCNYSKTLTDIKPKGDV